MTFASLLKNDIADRAIKTFVQAFIAQALAVQGADAKTVYVSAIAAGLSAVWAAVVGPWLTKVKAARAAKKA